MSRQQKRVKAITHCKSDGGVRPRVDFMSAESTEDKDYFRLSLGEFEAMSERLEDIQEINAEMTQALGRFAETIRIFSTKGTPTAREINAMNRLATAHEERASEAFNLLTELLTTLLNHELDELLHKLDGPEICRCVRKRSKPIQKK